MRYRSFLTVAGALVFASLLFSGATLAFQVDYHFSWNDDIERCPGNGYEMVIDITNQFSNQILITRVAVHLDWQPGGVFDEDHSGSGWMSTGDTYSVSFFIPIPGDAYEGYHSFEVQVDYDVDDGNASYSDTYYIFGGDFYVESLSHMDVEGRRNEAMDLMNELDSLEFQSQDAEDQAQQARDAFDNAENAYAANDWDNALANYEDSITYANEAIDIEQNYDGNGNGSEGGWSFNASVDWDSIGTGVSSGGFMMLIVITLISTLVAMPLVYYFSKTW